MTKARFLKLLKTEQWYKQGGGIKPLYIGYPWKTCYTRFTVNHQPVPLYYRNMVGYMRDHYFDVYFPKRTMGQVANYYASRDFRWAERLLVNWSKQDAAPLRKYMQNLERSDFSRLSSAGLRRVFLDFSKQYDRLWREAIFLDAFDCVGDELLNAAAKRHAVILSDNELHTLTTPTKPSWLQRERMELLELAKTAGRNRTLAALARKGQVESIAASYPSFHAKLLAHQQRYHWIYNDYAVVRQLDAKFFLERIAHLLKNKAELAREAKELKEIGTVSRRQEKLIAGKKLPKQFVNIARILTTFARWRDERKSHNQMANAVIFKFAQDTSRRTDIKHADLEMLFWPELSQVLGGNRTSTRRIPSRLQGLFFTGDQHNPKTAITGAQGKALWTALEDAMAAHSRLEGRPAFPGLVRGTARIVRHQGEFHKMKKGDILIAPNTRPEYVPIMKIAGAIITVEGGVTSHAAIVSRELRVPCIVGVQTATRSLNDGDVIEVDANKGIVRKI